MSAIKPGAQSGAKMISHQGEEAGLVIKGRLALEVDGARYELAEGDAYRSTAASRTRFATPARASSSSFPPARRRRSSVAHAA